MYDTSSAEGSPPRQQKKKPRYQTKTNLDKRKTPMLSVNDVVNGILNKPEFGHSFYKTPSNEMLMKKVPFGHSAKYKHLTFGAQVMKDKQWVPSPSLYKLDYNWQNMLPKDNGKFKIDKRQTYIDQIFYLSKKKERSSPGVGNYKEDQKWVHKSKHSRTLGTYTVKDSRVTLYDEKIHHSMHVPASNKYNKPDIEKLKERSPKPKIYKTNYPRFSPVVKNAQPGPSTYNAATVQNKIKMSSTMYSMKKAKKVSYFDDKVAQNISPGAG